MSDPISTEARGLSGSDPALPSAPREKTTDPLLAAHDRTVTGDTTFTGMGKGQVGTGSQLGPYQLLEKLGEGGSGAVYKALHTKLGMLVALKVLPPHMVAKPSAVTRFEREMMAVGRLRHPHIVQALDAGDFGGVHYLSMEYVEGEDLQKLVALKGPMSSVNACKAIRQAAQGLAAAHELGIVHRDIKPSNLFVTKGGRIKILDMGLALLSEDQDNQKELTSEGQCFGTADYMAPEQWEDSHKCDARTDLYALGCTLFRLLIGTPPYGGDDYKTFVRKMQGHCRDPVPDLCALRPDIPAEVGAIFRKLAAKRPEDRYASADELVEALAPFASRFGPATGSPADSAEAPPSRKTDPGLNDHGRGSIRPSSPSVQKIAAPPPKRPTPPARPRFHKPAAESSATSGPPKVRQRGTAIHARHALSPNADKKKFTIAAVLATVAIGVGLGLGISQGQVVPWAVGTGIVLIAIVKFWLESDLSLYPRIDRLWRRFRGQESVSEHEDLDDAWEAGLENLRLSGIDVDDVPLFLVTGLRNELETQSLMAASGFEFSVAGVTEGKGPLHWYATEKAIYLCLTEVSHVGLAARNKGEEQVASGSPTSGGGTGAAMPVRGFSGTMFVPGHEDDAGPPVGVPARPFSGTMFVPGEGDDGTSDGASVPGFSSDDSPRGTMQWANSADEMNAILRPTRTVARRLSAGQLEEVRERLAHVCRLLRNRKQPDWPVNGVISVLPFDMLATNAATAGELERCVAADLKTLRDELQLRCPVTALVCGMEAEGGFLELARRLGRDAVKTHRFGKGSDLWTQPEPELVEAVVKNACGGFEDWAYHLFSTEDGLDNPGNPELFSLLCRTRSEIQDPLTTVLCGGYGSQEDADAMPFSGVYFAATGPAEDEQGFVTSVFEKVHEQEDEVRWTEAALEEDLHYRTWKSIALVANLLLMAAIAGLAYLWFSNR